MAYQELFQHSVRYLKFRKSGTYTSTRQDLRTITGQSSNGLIAGMIAKEYNYASSQLWTHWRSHCPMSQTSPRTNIEWSTVEKDQILMPCTHSTCRSHKIYQTGRFAIILFYTMLSESQKFHAKKFYWNKRRPSVAINASSSGKPEVTIHGHSMEKPAAW